VSEVSPVVREGRADKLQTWEMMESELLADPLSDDGGDGDATNEGP